MDDRKVKRNIPVAGNACISYGVTWNADGSPRGNEPHPFCSVDDNQRAWRVGLMLEGRHWCIPMTFASQRDATIAAVSIAPYFSECKTAEDARRVVEERGYDWLRARLTENLRW